MADNIAFIGIGHMGYHMASHLRKKMKPSATLVINDAVPAACERFVKDFSQFGPIQVVGSAKEAANEAGVIVSILPSPAVVYKVFLDKSTGVIAASSAPKRLILECSTIDRATSLDVGKQLAEAGAGVFVDTPVSGGTHGAENATLAFMMGSREDEEVGPMVQNIVGMMGGADRLIFCGARGTGLAAKITNNYISCCILLATAEGMAAGIRAGVEPHTLHKVIHNSGGDSWVLNNLQPAPGIVPHAPSSRNYDPTFVTPMVLKDIGLGIDMANETGIQPNMADMAISVFRKAAEDPRCKTKDVTSVWLYINDIKENSQ